MPGIVVGVIQGGPEAVLFRENELLTRVMREIESSLSDPDDWSVNAVFIIPGRLSRPEFAGIRTGKFDRLAERLMIQIAVPDVPFAGWIEMTEFVLGCLSAATEEAAGFFEAEGLDVDVTEAWGQIGALRRELELEPRWAVELPDGSVDSLTPEERAVLDVFESKRALDAPIRAELRLLAAEKGGRHFPVSNGHTSQCRLDMTDEWGQRPMDEATFYVEDGDSVGPGDVGLIRIHPVRPERWAAVDVGSVIEVCEGPRVVGWATITELFGMVSE